MRYISLSTLFGVSFGAQSWDPELMVFRPQALASSRRSKSHPTPARLHVTGFLAGGVLTKHFRAERADRAARAA